MKGITKMTTRLIMILLALAPIAATARPDFYFALGGGKSQLNEFDELGTAIYTQMIDEQFKVHPVFEQHASRERTTWAYTATAGAEFGKHFAAELSYTTFAKPDGSWSKIGWAQLPDNLGRAKYLQTMTARTDGLALSAIGYWPLDLGYRLYAHGGALYARSHAKGTLCRSFYDDSVGEFCSPQVTNDALTGEPIGGFASGHLGDVTFTTHSIMPRIGFGLECIDWVPSFDFADIGWRIDYSISRVRNPSLQGIPSAGLIQFLSIAAKIRFRDHRDY